MIFAEKAKTTIKAMAEEEKTNLSLALLREWWISSTSSLVKEVGSEKALAQLRPYFYNTGSAGGQNIPVILGVTEANASKYNIGIHMWPLVIGGRLNGVYLAEDSQIYEYAGCGTEGRCREGCVCMCQYTWQASIDGSDPGHVVTIRKSIAVGDEVCEILAGVEGKQLHVRKTEESRVPDEQLPPLLARDIWVYLAHAYLGECWSNATRALIDLVGAGKALSLLQPMMRESGRAYVARMAGRTPKAESSAQRIHDLIDLVQSLHQQKVAVNPKGEGVEGTVTECPFSSSSPEICLQYEAFFNGVCEVIDPDYSFAYDRTMAGRDKTCHWTICRKGSRGREKSQGSLPTDDPSKTLANRLAKGEISEEEFDRKMALLRKHQIVK
jgi:hypothetical protein